jgi:prevent-host-death family protein
MTKQVNLYEAKTHLSELVDEAAKGNEIIIAKNDKPLARLVPLAKRGALRKRKLGVSKLKFVEVGTREAADEEVADLILNGKLWPDT